MTGIFSIFCTIGIVWVQFHKEPEITVSGYYIVPWAITVVLTALLVLILFICEMILVIKERDNSRIIKLIAEIFIGLILGVALEIFIYKDEINIFLVWGSISAICMVSFALKYWKRKTV